jgi:hypothetical protein
MPSDREVRDDFLKENPTWQVKTVDVGEGDGAAVYFHIRHTRPGEPQTYEEIWQYLDEGTGPWKLKHKENALPLGDSSRTLSP